LKFTDVWLVQIKTQNFSLRNFLAVFFVSQQTIFFSEHKVWNVAPWVFWTDLMQPIFFIGNLKILNFKKTFHARFDKFYHRIGHKNRFLTKSQKPSQGWTSKFWVFCFVSGHQDIRPKCRQICSIMKFAQHNFHFPILSRNLYGRYLPLLCYFEVLVIFKIQNCWTKVQSVLFYGDIRWTKLSKIVILPYFPYNPKAKLRLEVLFKKFHPRINLATLFSTKSYLLNTIKPFLRPWKPFLDQISKTFIRGTLKFWVCRTSSWPKKLREPK
jgi:hypothetical protein